MQGIHAWPMIAARARGGSRRWPSGGASCRLRERVRDVLGRQDVLRRDDLALDELADEEVAPVDVLRLGE
eukprot:3479530-Prymnesium_polylepis.1